MFGLGLWELVLIILVVMLLFGAGKLPKVMADLGKGLKSFKESLKEGAENLSASSAVEIAQEKTPSTQRKSSSKTVSAATKNKPKNVKKAAPKKAVKSGVKKASVAKTKKK